MWTLPVLVPFIRFWYLSDVAESKILSARGSWRMCGFCWVPTRKHWTLRVPHANAWLTNMGTVRLVRQHLSAQVEIQCDYSQYKLTTRHETSNAKLMKIWDLKPQKFHPELQVGPKTAFKWGPKTTIHHAHIIFGCCSHWKSMSFKHCHAWFLKNQERSSFSRAYKMSVKAPW